jgi:HEAT repeat protein
MRSTSLSALAFLLVLGLASVSGGADTTRPARTNTDGSVSRLDKIGGKTFDDWKKDLHDSDPAVVENAIRTIPLYGPGLAREVVPTLVRKLKIPNLDVSIKVCTAIFLGTIGLDGAELDDGVSGLIHLLKSDQVIVKLQASLALAQIGDDAKEAIPALLLNLSHYSWEIRKASARALASVARPRSEKTAPDSKVIERLRSHLLYIKQQYPERCAQVRKEAAMALVALGPPSAENERTRVVESLKAAALQDRDKTVQIWAHVGVMRMTKIDPKRLDKIGDFLSDPVLGVRCEAARVLGLIGSDAKSQVRKLVKVLDDKDPLMLTQVITTLAEMGNAAQGAVERLEKLAKNTKDKGLQAGVEAAIKAIQAQPKKKVDG